ncbi:helicase DnaB [Mammaliicoccus sciuri]|uniref:DnaB-like helicase C-terminal domain-containing protein n=1 Tax=Mammaliicoccus sciuri TaxID=1296 RepID=UPI0019D35FDF|nr:DnaB-like helicase C-terminal domain-containing protein [Mammaliicoccus sciuri]QSN68452.1 helicase DnaB [Mammaliicoccus sciuri]UIU23193.1 helicase DnaB [Mammaliicoccus sciuri]UIU26098.1 helicase DnaB [Mammaliicoccus sciuri]
MELFPKKAICSALACLMREPSLLDNSKIELKREYFEVKGESKFYQIIFAAITNLYADGLQTISPSDIDEFLSHYDSFYETYNQNNGIEFLQHIEELSNIDAYPRYATRIKKFALLRDIRELGFSIEPIYQESDDTDTNTELQAKFEQMTVNDVIKYYDELVNSIQNKYMVDDTAVSGTAGSNGLELLKSFKEAPQYGVTTCGLLQNSIFRGQLLGKSMLRSASTNTFKSRTSLAEATDLAINRWYDWELNQWVDKGRKEKVLYISTEMEQEDLEPTIWAYISGVKEDKIRDHVLTDFEKEIVVESIKDLDNTKNFFIEYVPDFDINSINTLVKRYAIHEGVDYVFFDYIHLNFNTMIEVASATRGMNQREDMVIGTFAAGLAEMALKYKFHLSTSSQVNGDVLHNKKLDQNVLRGAKNMPDKFSKACIMTRPDKEDLKEIEPIINKGVWKHEPNMIWHIYKNRHSKFKGKLYLYVDFDTMRMTDLFMTDDNGTLMNVPERELIIKEVEETEESLPF